MFLVCHFMNATEICFLYIPDLTKLITYPANTHCDNCTLTVVAYCKMQKLLTLKHVSYGGRGTRLKTGVSN